MIASSRALVCLLACHIVCWAELSVPEKTPLDLYLQAGTSQPETVLTDLRAEVTQLMGSAGYDIHWSRPQSTSSGMETRLLAVVKLEGVCGVTESTPTEGVFSPDLSLGTSVVQNGRVLPFITVNCGLLGDLIDHNLQQLPQERRDFLKGRAAARVLAHELFHVLANSEEHTSDGITKARFGSRDLLSEQFTFEPAALHTLQQRRERLHLSQSDPAPGRPLLAAHAAQGFPPQDRGTAQSALAE